MIRARSNTYVCWSCLWRRTSLKRSSNSTSRLTQVRHTSTARSKSVAQTRPFATVHHLDGVQSPDAVPFTGGPLSRPIRHVREKLRQWDAENMVPDRVQLRDYARIGSTRNSNTRTESIHQVDLDVEPEDERALFDDDEVVDLRPSASALEAGDLIELSSDSWRVQLLAVCLGHFNGCDHFFAQSGKWFTSQGPHTLFVVKKFATLKELQPVVDALPPTDAPLDIMHVFQELKLGPSRGAGANMLRKMLQFSTAAEVVFQRNSKALDNIFKKLDRSQRYLTLQQLAAATLPHLARKGKAQFTPAELYAVHRAVMADDIAFRPLARLSDNQTYMFEVSSDEDVVLVRNMENTVRRFYELEGAASEAHRPSHVELLDGFLKKARVAIDYSRRSRQWSPHGMLGPSTVKLLPRDNDWTPAEVKILDFLHLWGSLDQFSRSSRLHWIGSAILRALARYSESEYLTTSTAWTFLQEVGWIKPWDIQARYGMHLPGARANRTRGLDRGMSAQNETTLLPDSCEGIRRDWNHVKAYCIDSAGTTDIDDAVSLERTDNADEFLIHVHVADPASGLLPKSPMATMAEVMPQTIYLSGYFERMLPDAFRTQYSLAPGRPCLTFTSKVNVKGELLDYSITPGTLGEVVYISPDEVAAICGQSHIPVPEESFSVGRPPTVAWTPNRRMLTRDDLNTDEISELKTLHQLGEALQSVRLANGAVPVFLPRPVVQVSFDHTKIANLPGGFFHCTGDPHIRIAYESSSSRMVESIMRLAGEVAARWCDARHVPIPYRTQPGAARNAVQLRALADDVIFPQMRAGLYPSPIHRRALAALFGGGDLAVDPAPNFLMGVPMYTRATSPLRRFGDLLLHWQIHGALRAERDPAGKPPVAAHLPFSRAELEHAVLPMLRVRERALRALDRADGAAQWMLQALVRAWRFGEAELPPSFRFTVASVVPRRALRGRLDWFDRPAVLEARALDVRGLRMEGVREGDVLEVVLEDVNVHGKEIFVRAVRLLEGGGEGEVVGG